MARRKADFLGVLREYFTALGEEIRGKTVCVCLSGGADSVALLRGSLLIKDDFGFEVCACHFNHMIRGAEADRDENFCKSLCESLGVKLYRGRDDVPAYAKKYKKSLEEAARECRYAFFERMLNLRRFDFYAAAHNMNDDAETLIMNLVRGSGSNGASSLAARSGELIRPMLHAKRSDIEEFLSDLGQEFMHDSTNDSLEYTRNYVRNVIIPELCNINPKAVEALAGFADSARNDRAYFESVIADKAESDLRELPDSLLDRIIFRKYKGFSGKIANSEQLKLLKNAVRSGKREVISLDAETEAIVNNGIITLLDARENIPYFPETIINNGENKLFGGRVTAILNKNDVNDINFNKLSIKQTLSFDNICGELRVRQRVTGDRIRIFGVNRSVKKLFIEKKIPKELRDLIPVFFDDNGIIYIPFVGIADRAFPKNANQTFKLITILNNIDKERWPQAYEK